MQRSLHELNWFASFELLTSLGIDRIVARTRSRVGVFQSNFEARLDAADAQLAKQLTRDPYVFDFLDLNEQAAERDLG